MKKEGERLSELKHSARRKSIKEGIFAVAKGSFGDYFISPFAIAINTSSSLVALLSSISGILGPLSQMFGSRLLEKYSRKKIVLRTVFFESLMWIPFIAIAFLFYKGIITSLLPIFLLLSFALYITLANLAGPAWFSWMGDIVDEKFRGRWFAKRNLILGFITVILALTASFFLDYFKKQNMIMLGFGIFFTLALFSRLISWRIFKKQYEPKIKLKKGYYFSFTDFVLKCPKTNFGKFAIFRTLFSFAAGISAPLLAVYLLRNLGFEYKTYMLITLAGTVFSLLVLALWGKFADKYGNYRTIFLTSLFLPIIPILWILSPSPIYLLLVPSIISGISWAGFNLATGNFIYDNVSQEKRGLVVSYYNMLVGIATALGAGVGALLIKFLPTIILAPIVLIFLLGAVLRLIVTIWWLPKIKEVKKKAHFKGTTAFKNIILKQARPTLLEEAHQIMSIKEYLRE